MRALKIMIAMTGVGVAAGCHQPPSRLNAPPQGYTESPAEGQEVFVYMVDNAMLSDMSMADLHFVAHTPELNSLGLRRLDRYGKLLKIYGGTIRYDTRLIDDELVSGRMNHITEYLTVAGVDPERMDVKKDLPGGYGLLAVEASNARKNSMVKEKASEGGGGFEDLLKMMMGGGSQ